MSVLDPATAGNAASQDASAAATGLAPLRILVAEDEFLLGIQLEEELQAAGHTVLGPYTNVARATEACRNELFDIALLDVNLHGELIYPLADELTKRGVPFVLLSGYGAANLPERLRTIPRVAKPHDSACLVREMQRALAKTG
jgi:DNA-binding NtrC family response regulator